MAKIKKYTFNASDDDTQQEYSVDIYYSTKEGWFANLHSEFKDSFHDRYEDLKPHGAAYVYASQRDRMMDQNAKPIIKGENEGDVCRKVKYIYNILLSTTVVKRKVIIVFFIGDRSTFYNRHWSDGEYEQVQMQFGLNFCTEVKASPTAPPKYYKYKTYQAFGEERIDRRELIVYGNATTIVDDTEENRNFLTGLYQAYVNLRDQLKKFTESEEALLQLISSNVKLIGNGKDQIQES